jgi:hypothetical protein
LEDGHEERFANKEAFARAEERAKKAGAAALLGAIAENGFHFDAVVHVHHAAGFGDGGFHGVQFDFDELHVIAEDFKVDFVHCGHVISDATIGLSCQANYWMHLELAGKNFADVLDTLVMVVRVIPSALSTTIPLGVMLPLTTTPQI